MASKVLKLDQLHLTSVADKLKLSMTSSAHLRIPNCLSHLDQEETVKALASGNVWISRGISCGLNFHIYFDGKCLERNGRIHVVESLGYRLRDAHLWSQLFFSPSLHVSDPEDSQLDGTLSNPDLSIRLGHGKPPADTTDPEAWLSSNIDLKPPGGVSCAHLERLNIALDFHTFPKERRPKAKRVKTEPKGSTAPDAALLDDSAIDHDSHLGDFEKVVGNLSRSLSGSIASCFEHFPIPGVSQGSPTGLLAQPPGGFDNSEVPEKVSSGNNDSLGDVLHSRQGNLILNAPLDEDVLLLSDHNLSLPTPSQYIDEEMLFSQTTESTPSLLSQSTTLSTISTASTLPSTFPLKRSFPSDTSLAAPGEAPCRLDVSPACKLSEAGLRILIGGYSPRRTRMLGIRIDKPPPETSLSDLAPGLFSPDFKVSVSQNARYLPTISHAFASWPPNVLSPILQRKLFQLAYSPPSTLDPGSEDAGNHEAVTDPLMSVIQARLWAMMQRKLYDPTAARAAFNPRSSDKSLVEMVDEDQDEDLLAELGNSMAYPEGRSMVDDLDFVEDEFGDVDEFEDLLGRGDNDDDDLLEYMDASERERLEVEHETNEMLFGGSYDEELEGDDEDMLFLEPGCDNESMLL